MGGDIRQIEVGVGQEWKEREGMGSELGQTGSGTPVGRWIEEPGYRRGYDVLVFGLTSLGVG